ncbi:hypothetical protein DFH09DRAFT_1203040, partial [Mycena vulgaris]
NLRFSLSKSRFRMLPRGKSTCTYRILLVATRVRLEPLLFQVLCIHTTNGPRTSSAFPVMDPTTIPTRKASQPSCLCATRRLISPSSTCFRCTTSTMLLKHCTSMQRLPMRLDKTWSGLAQMPHLTHLSFHNNNIPKSVIHSALVECPSLIVLIIIFSTQTQLDVFMPHPLECITDPRVIVLLVADPLADWEAGAWGGEDYWLRA